MNSMPVPLCICVDVRFKCAWFVYKSCFIHHTSAIMKGFFVFFIEHSSSRYSWRNVAKIQDGGFNQYQANVRDKLIKFSFQLTLISVSCIPSHTHAKQDSLH